MTYLPWLLGGGARLVVSRGIWRGGADPPAKALNAHLIALKENGAWL